jgi:hypothetical protein
MPEPGRADRRTPFCFGTSAKASRRQTFEVSIGKNYNLYISCESDEDLPYLMDYIGEDNLITGSDYGHHGGQVPTKDAISFENRTRGGDPSGDLAVFAELAYREDITEEQRGRSAATTPPASMASSRC